MDRAAIVSLSPTTFMAQGGAPIDRLALDEHCRRSFVDYRGTAERIDPSKFYGGAFGLDYFVNRFDAGAFYMLPLLQQARPDLAQLSALEIGCGPGLVSLGMCSGFRKYVGLDVDSHMVETAAAICRSAGVRNTSFRTLDNADPGGLIASLDLDGEPDVIVLAASLEHHTPEERAHVFRYLKRRIEGGAMVLAFDTPNRLIPFDAHSSELHFVQMLPDYLAAQYTKRHSRDFFKAYLSRYDWPAGDPRWHGKDVSESLHRLGRGMSYHDFEVHLEDIRSVPVVVDGWNPLRLNFQPLARAELELERYLALNCPEIHRSYSRYWLDLGFSKTWAPLSPGMRARHLTPRASGSVTAYQRPQWYALDTYVAQGEGSVLEFDLQGQTLHSVSLILDGEIPDQEFDLVADGSLVTSVSLAALARARPPTWHKTVAFPVPVPLGLNSLVVRPRGGSTCVSQGLVLS